ncbi:hypothetical protein ACEXQB_009990 [Herbiconiux sp. P18]|uniref:hypothetical protein n=1 Tax=Herbiconiux liangxiaofengii TaxID=3342795 RepID=UPI0035BAC794
MTVTSSTVPGSAAGPAAPRGLSALVPGYVLTELVSVGPRANVFRAVATAKPGHPVIMKVWFPDARAACRAECEVLARHPVAAMPSLVACLRTVHDDPVTVMTLCEGRPPREWPPPCVPALVALITSLHAMGIAHGALSRESILIDSSGAPVLISFGHAVMLDTPPDLPDGGAGTKPPEPHRVVFERARAHDLRVLLALTRAGPAHPAPGDMAGQADDPWAWQEREPAAAAEVHFIETLEPAVSALHESWRAVRRLLRHRRQHVLRGSHRRVAVGAASAIVLGVVVAAVLLPSPPTASAPSGARGLEGATSPTGTMNDATPSSSGGAGTAVGTPGVTASDSSAPTPAPPPADGPPPPGDPQDVPAAVAALLDARWRCVAGGGGECLGGADQWNSPAYLADQELARENGPPDPLGHEVVGLTVAQQFGGMVLLTGAVEADTPGTTKPVSLLVVRSETGWRLRSYEVSD